MGQCHKGGCENYQVYSFARLETFSQSGYCIKDLTCTFNSGIFFSYFSSQLSADFLIVRSSDIGYNFQTDVCQQKGFYCSALTAGMYVPTVG